MIGMRGPPCSRRRISRVAVAVQLGHLAVHEHGRVGPLDRASSALRPFAGDLRLEAAALEHVRRDRLVDRRCPRPRGSLGSRRAVARRPPRALGRATRRRVAGDDRLDLLVEPRLAHRLDERPVQGGVLRRAGATAGGGQQHQAHAAQRGRRADRAGELVRRPRPGMCRSSSASAKGMPAARGRLQQLQARAALSATSQLIRQELSWRSRILRLVALSSTTRTRRPASDGSSCGAPSPACARATGS